MKLRSERDLPRTALKDVELVLRSSLQSMLATPESQRPFVVVQDMVTERFVQFCGSLERGVMFDVPALGIVAEPCTVSEGVQRALDTLRGPLALPDEAELVVVFDTQPGAERSYDGGRVSVTFEMPSDREIMLAKLSLIKAARAFGHWARSRVNPTNRRKFARATLRLHKAAERYALCLPPAQS